MVSFLKQLTVLVRNSCKAKISEVIVKEQVITSSAEMAEAFNNYFSSVGKNLADEIPLPENEPEDYLEPTDTTFSLKPPSIDIVNDLLLFIDEKKSVVLDRIPNKLLKLLVMLWLSSLIAIFATSISTGIFPQEWKTSRV